MVWLLLLAGAVPVTLEEGTKRNTEESEGAFRARGTHLLKCPAYFVQEVDFVQRDEAL